MRKGVKEDVHYITYFTLALIVIILIIHSFIIDKIENKK
jgi:hypothetical protein